MTPPLKITAIQSAFEPNRILNPGYIPYLMADPNEN